MIVFKILCVLRFMNLFCWHLQWVVTTKVVKSSTKITVALKLMIAIIYCVLW